MGYSMGVLMGLSGVTPQPGGLSAILRCACGATIPDKRRGRGAKFCSRRCKDEEYNRAHPVSRQARLDFSPVRPAPPTGEPYESARLWLLARLQQGPVSTLELRREPWPASLNPAQRVLELRNRQYRIKTERVEGKTYYRLEQEG